MLPNLGIPEIAVIVFLALLIFGPRRIGSLARSIGRSYFQVRKEVNDVKSTFKVDPDDPEKKSENKSGDDVAKKNGNNGSGPFRG